jgi:hypothetical protein
MMFLALVCQIALLAFHQITTFVDFLPFNGARFYSVRERLVEMSVNAILMTLAPIGYVFQIQGLIIYGVIYYFVLFTVEVAVWWIPYFTVPHGKWRNAYNAVLSVATSDFKKGDALERWLTVYQRIHANTVIVLPIKNGRIVPNLEHLLLHGWTLVTAIATLAAYRAG